MDDFDGDIRPPELSSWALSLLRGDPLPMTMGTETATATSSCFTTRKHQAQTQTQLSQQTTTATNSKSNRFFKSLNLGQASRLNDEGVFESLKGEEGEKEREGKRKLHSLTPQRGSSPQNKRHDQQKLNNNHDDHDHSLEIGRKQLINNPMREINAESIWNKMSDIENELVLDFKPSSSSSHQLPKEPARVNIKDQIQQDKKENVKKGEPQLMITVNDKEYTVVEQIGRGGSSKVFKTHLNKRNYAIKIVNFDNDEDDITTINELKGEIQILKKLKDCSRVIDLIDYEIGYNCIKIVMECGEIDLAHVIQSKFKNEGFNEQFVRFHVNEMIQCIKQVHDRGVVHSDLKPANFIFVKGTLKLIDFGISNAITGVTVNVYRECQMGTPNYMSPETLIEVPNDNNSIWKIGKPSDIWSIGCITYQLTYGHPPYHSYLGTKKILAITNPKINILFPPTVNDVHIPDSLIQFMKRCLIRNPQLRSTADELLNSTYLSPICISRGVLRDIVKWSVVYGSKHEDIGHGLNTAKGKKHELNELERRSLVKLDTLVENLIQKVNQR